MNTERLKFTHRSSRRESAQNPSGKYWSRLTSAATGLVILAALSSIAVGANPLEFNGAPVELTLSQVSDRCVRIQLTPLDENGKPKPAAPSAALAEFPQKEKLRLRELAKEKQLSIGSLRLVLTPKPLAIAVYRKDKTLV